MRARNCCVGCGFGDAVTVWGLRMCERCAWRAHAIAPTEATTGMQYVFAACMLAQWVRHHAQ